MGNTFPSSAGSSWSAAEGRFCGSRGRLACATGGLVGLTFKIRSKTMRGFKSLSKALAHPHLAYYLRGNGQVCDLRKII